MLKIEVLDTVHPGIPVFILFNIQIQVKLVQIWSHRVSHAVSPPHNKCIILKSGQGLPGLSLSSPNAAH